MTWSRCFGNGPANDAMLLPSSNWFIRPAMSSTTTERSNCQFAVRRTGDGKVVVMVQLLHDTISPLRNVTVGFDLRGGTKTEQAKELTDLLNEYVIGVFVSWQQSNLGA